MTEYAKRDARALEPYYYRHVSAMTHERLDAKSDIAAELAWRDQQIDELRKTTENLAALLAKLARFVGKVPGDYPSALAERATDYLERKGVLGSPLREAKHHG